MGGLCLCDHRSRLATDADPLSPFPENETACVYYDLAQLLGNGSNRLARKLPYDLLALGTWLAHRRPHLSRLGRISARVSGRGVGGQLAHVLDALNNDARPTLIPIYRPLPRFTRCNFREDILASIIPPSPPSSFVAICKRSYSVAASWPNDCQPSFGGHSASV